MQDMSALPAPPAPPAPKRNVWKWVAIGFAILIVGGAAGNTLRESEESADNVRRSSEVNDAVNDIPSGGLDPIEVEDESDNWDYDQATEYLLQAGSEVLQITETSPIPSDVRHMNTAADLTDMAALLVGPQDAIRLRDVADHMRLAATFMELGDYESAIPELDAATAGLEEYTNAPMG